jgi:two-component system sensor histidine kinase UhpB
MLEEAGLEEAVSTHIPLFEKQMGIEIRYEVTGKSPVIDPNIAIHVYRVLQEALNNVARHSNSKQASVRMRYLPDSVLLEVEDNGVGLGNLTNGHGIGLVSMRERADLVNGRLELIEPPAGGLLVRLTAPLGKEAEHADG